ncbi:MAG: DNA polymerase III subunit delta' [Candidatus Cloacimonetes bacterium]|jgi:DNA polymerase-3 subunit delta'|nr:DNA polymerase III subunit delta' [Candidatus Cloacimonadota bacterium]MDD4224068.1 DNA polymerase III subunit delta' [Candidatus Cloacimonadota bacterium]
MFRNIKGQSNALQILKLALDNDRIAQAYLFHGSDGVGKFTAALYFGMALNCFSKSEFRPCGVCSSCRKFLALDHPDLLYIFPTPNLGLNLDGEITKTDYIQEYEGYIRNKIETPWEDYQFSANIMIRVESMNWLIKRLNLSAYEASYRVCIIEDADQMNIPTANAFLKTLEEPPEATVIILITNNLSKLLPTIVSRCQPVHFQPVTPSVIEGILRESFNAAPELARTAAHIADGSVQRAIHFAHNESLELREHAFGIFEMAATGKDLAHFRQLRSLPRSFNAESAIEVLRYLSLFAGDLNLALDAPEQLVNIDKRDFLAKAREALGEIDPAVYTDRVIAFVLLMEGHIRKLRGNANLQLVMLDTYFQLKKLFRA